MNSPPFRKRLKRTVRYVLLRAAIALVRPLPLAWAAALGKFFGGLAFSFAATDRTRALDSLMKAYPALPPMERRALAYASFQHLGTMLFELACAPQLDARVTWSGRDVLDAALARKKGVVFVSAHLGNWELLARHVAQAGYPCQTIAKETTDPRTTALIENFRQNARLKSIWRGRDGAAKAMIRALHAGEILGMLIDQDTDVQSVWVPFFGHPAKTPRAAADLALRTGAALILGFCVRQRDGRYALTMAEVPVVGDATQLTASLTAQIEEAIRGAPQQWVWMHRRWKTPPAGGSVPP